MADVEGALRSLQAFVVNQWKSGGAAELRLFCESGRLKASVSADFGPFSPSWRAKSASMGGSGSTSRQRRRESRAAARAAAVKAGIEKETAADDEVTAVNAVPVKSAAEKCVALKDNAEKCSAKDSAAEKCDARKAAAEKCDATKVVSEKYEARKAAAEKCDAEKDVAEGALTSADVASTSCLGSQPTQEKTCWTCEGYLTSDHQCDGPPGHDSGDVTLFPPPVPPNPDKDKVDELPPLPLCLYCCHRGDGEHKVHYYGVCICSESECSCFCYCTDEQFEFKKQYWPNGLGSRRAVGPEGRAKAEAFALASEWISDAPCMQKDCCMRCSFDSPCTGGPQCPTRLDVI